MNKRSKWFYLRYLTADPHYGIKVNRYPKRIARGRRLVGFSFHFKYKAISVGRYL